MVWFGSSMISSISEMDAFIGKAPDSGNKQNKGNKLHFSLEMMVWYQWSSARRVDSSTPVENAWRSKSCTNMHVFA